MSLLTACQQPSAPSGPAPLALQEARAARFVKFEQVTEWSGKPWAAMAELNLIDSTGRTVDRALWTATADSAGDSDGPRNAIDGNPATHWHSQWEADPAPPPPHWFVVALGRPVKLSGFRYLPRQDGNANGAIAGYKFYLSDDGTQWGEPVAAGDFTTMGAPTVEKVVVFAAQTANHPPQIMAVGDQTGAMGRPVSLQLTATDADGDMLGYRARGLPPGLELATASGLISGSPITPGNYDVALEVSDGKAAPVTASFHWTVGTALQSAAVELARDEVRFAKLEEVSEVGGNAWASMAEFNLIGPDGGNLPRTGWVAAADSAGTSDQPQNAIDDNPRTVWHTKWEGDAPAPPHTFVVDMGRGAKVTGFRYLPRQDGLVNGTIGKFRFYTSVDGIEWGKPLAEGDFARMGPPATEKTVTLR